LKHAPVQGPGRFSLQALSCQSIADLSHASGPEKVGSWNWDLGADSRIAKNPDEFEVPAEGGPK